MLMTVALALSLGNVPPEAAVENNATCKKDIEQYCSEAHVSYELGRNDLSVQLAMNIGIGEVTTIHFPVGVAVSDQGVEFSQGIFEIVVKEHRITIRPRMPANAAKLAKERNLDKVQELLLGERGNLQIATRRGWRINIDLRVWFSPESVRSLTFTSKEVATEEELIDERISAGVQVCEDEKVEILKGMEELAANKSVLLLAHELLDGTLCDDSTTTDFRDSIWARQFEVCKVGIFTVVKFKIQNRGADPLQLGPVSIRNEESVIESKTVFQSSTKKRLTSADNIVLLEDEKVTGASIYETSAWSGQVSLQINEASGRHRVVELHDIGF